MAKAFNKLKDPKLHLDDKLTFGKFAGCRIRDLFPDSWEYLKWLSQNTNIAFGQDVLDTITEFWKQDDEKRHYEEEVKPWTASTGSFFDGFDDTYDDDIPF